jgi:hypothetical protein
MKDNCDNRPAMSPLGEFLFTQAGAMQTAYKMGAETERNLGECSRKLQRLIAAAEEAAPQLECVDIRSAEKLRAAIAEARRA